ncbi:Wzz/FepE/Etk N-terminal domain-containing protein [Pseudorhodobacter aquimaris]|uniref:Wzz/FepE/Etk N-terminal domain-containing protein n=1 Tax=Pseudorhodobacter aquimaris TaxID=687412 RepID=UPI00067C7231|nr:Wzz/FepE/Etk N-terminal domain-containing protein [Pseudorhodobacter aquimaris]
MGKIQSFDEFFGMLIRRRLMIALIALLGITATVLQLSTKEPLFESTAVIQVQVPTITAPTASGTAAPHENSAQRLQAIQQQLTTRENMLAVIARHNLYADLALTSDQKVHILRQSLRFQTVASAAAASFGQPAEVSALLISAQANTRTEATNVANDFAQGVLKAGADSQRARTIEAQTFFQEEQRNLKEQIVAKEAEIAQFQSQNLDALPTQRDILQIELTGLETELRSLNQTLVGQRNERDATARKTNPRATDERRIATLNAQIETLSAQSNALQTRRAEIVGILSKAQEVDRTLAEFDRDLDQLQAQYEVATRRSADAETAAKLQDSAQGETFTLLEAAVEPDYPISGGKRKLVLVGAFASLIIGMIAAFVLEHLRPVLRTQRQLERELDLRPIVALPELRKSDLTPTQRGT